MIKITASSPSKVKEEEIKLFSINLQRKGRTNRIQELKSKGLL